MFKSRFPTHALRRSLWTSATQVAPRRVGFVAAGVLVAGTIAGTVLLQSPVYADANEKGEVPEALSKRGSKVSKKPVPSSGKNDLDFFTWGSNKYHTISSNEDYDTKLPSPFVGLSGEGVALRDVAFHERHATCIDAAGNLYQWGDGYFVGSPSESRQPSLTLRGKDLVKVVASKSKVYALSKAGEIYVVSSRRSQQALRNDTADNQLPWWNFWSTAPSVDCVEVSPDAKLHHKDRFTSISAGRSHLLAVTASGRAFASPISSSANAHGQLGIRKVLLSSPISDTPQPVELLPKAMADPFARSTPAIRTIASGEGNPPAAPLHETYEEDDIRYCNTLFEIPSLKGVEITQIVAGDRASYARTAKGGRVLSWGANEYGQLALGNTFFAEYVPVPMEVTLGKSYPRGTSANCIDLAAGGDVVYFTVETLKGDSGQSTTSVDLLAAGMGQWGSLGNNTYSQAQGSPSRIKAVSGLREYNEATQTTQPLAPKTVSASPTHHAMVALDTFHLDGNVAREDARKGRDLMVFGYNNDYQLGLGKRANSAQPVPLPSDSFAGGFDVDDKIGRMMVRERRVDVLRDLQGKKVSGKTKVEQTVVAGWGCSAVYWKVV